MSQTEIYNINESWQQDRPKILIVTCSDGRIQASIDEFLHRDLGILNYDRLYLPGGPGALSEETMSCAENVNASSRGDYQWSELKFLLTYHQK